MWEAKANGVAAEEQTEIAADRCTDESDRERLSAAADYLAGLRQAHAWLVCTTAIGTLP